MHEQDIALDIQAPGVEINNYLERKIRNMIKKLKTLVPGVSSMDLYLKSTGEPEKPKTVVARLGIAGPDLVVSDSGHRWKILLKNVEKRLIRQLEKRKALRVAA